MSSWSDLRRRLDPADRRVFAFMHPCLPGGPLVIRHTALMDAPAHSMRQLLGQQAASGTSQAESSHQWPAPRPAALAATHDSAAGGRVAAERQLLQPAELAEAASAHGVPAEPRVAVFYSISSTQPGLSGVDLGNFLIKKVARMVQVRTPTLSSWKGVGAAQLTVPLGPDTSFKA